MNYYDLFVIDDDIKVIELLEKYLSKIDISYKSFAKTEDFLAKIKSGQYPKVCLIDINLDQLDEGLSVIQALKRKAPENIKIICMSRRNAKADIISAFNAGADDYLQKPIDKDYLYSKLNRFIPNLDVPSPNYVKLDKRFTDIELVEYVDFISFSNNELVCHSNFLISKDVQVDIDLGNLLPDEKNVLANAVVVKNGKVEDSDLYFFTLKLDIEDYDIIFKLNEKFLF